MRRVMMMAVAAVVAFVVTAPAAAGEGAAAEKPWITKTYKVYVSPGEAMAFDAAMREHMALHKKAGDPQGMMAYQVVNGKHNGLTLFRQSVHGWAGFDEEMKIDGDEEHLMTKVLPHVKHVSSHIGIWQGQISRWPEELMAPKLVDVTVFDLTYAGMKDFMHAVKKLHEVIGEKGADWHYSWEMIVNGANGPRMVLAIPHENWADFAEPSPSMWQMAEEVLGEYEAQQLREAIGASIAHEESFVVALRPDLSYMPETK